MNDTNKDLLTAVCLNCGGKIEFSNKEDLVNCPFCGAGYSVPDLLNESDSVRIEKIKSQAYKDVESGKQQIEMERLKHEIEKEKKQEDKDSVDSFKKSKFSKVLIVFSIISVLLCVFAFSDGKVLAGIIAVIMVILFLISFLMGLHIFKEKKKGIRVIAAIFAFVLIVPYFNLYNSNRKNESEKIKWSDCELCDILPEPGSNVGKILIDSEENLMLYVYKTDKDGYNDYLSECEKMGFVVEGEKGELSYNAFNESGYRLELLYIKSDEELHIDLSAPIEMGKFEMPTSEIAKLLPVPNSNVGNILTDKSDSFEAYVGEISFDNYNDYVKACSDNGFNIDYNKGEKYYEADNEKGYTLRIEYEGFNTIHISVHAPKENNDEKAGKETESVNTSKQEEKMQTTSKEEKNAQTTSKEKSDNDTISMDVTPEFKETMDSYEEFFDEYVEFMKKYSESDNTLEMLEDYSNFMTKYAETMEKLNEINEDELSVADAAYYTEVMMRIDKKLVEVSANL